MLDAGFGIVRRVFEKDAADAGRVVDDEAPRNRSSQTDDWIVVHAVVESFDEVTPDRAQVLEVRKRFRRWNGASEDRRRRIAETITDMKGSGKARALMGRILVDSKGLRSSIGKRGWQANRNFDESLPLFPVCR